MIVDFRMRPPYRHFAEMDLFYDRSVVDPVIGSIFDMNSPDPASRAQRSMEAFMAEMDDAGIDVGVVIGRAAPKRTPERTAHLLSGTIPNDDVAAIVEEFPGRFVGFGGINGTDTAAALTEIDRCVQLGLKGVAFDNPLSDPPLYDDDDSLMALYERCQSHGLIVAITSSLYIGPDMTYSNPVHIQRVALAFPKLQIVVPHASWPWTIHMCGIASLCKNIYLIPDVYMNIEHMPGAQDYVDAANVGLGSRMLFASTYPTRPLKQSVETCRRLSFKSEDVRAAVLGGNAARLLNLA